IGFGFPVYAFAPPRWVLDRWEKSIPDSSCRQKAFVFLTAGSIFFNAASPVIKLINEKGYEVLRSTSYPMTDNFFPRLMQMSYLKSRIEKRFEDARKKVENEVKCLLSLEKNIEMQNSGCIPSIALKTISEAFELKGRKFFARKSYFDETCIKCQLCYRTCPTGAIKYEGERFVFSEDCIDCMRCYNICPVNAIIRFEQPRRTTTGIMFPGYQPPFVRDALLL
ncbi:MAG: EFR1 family ferrodoxin, partial [Candidatus Coatesbacteria bacterium]|nr:EFR1 family ferrodoxin [Candidatus Coatesbacteria bacterium]